MQTAASTLTLLTSAGIPITDQRVDLLRANGSNTGIRFNTNSNGEVTFEILPAYAHAFRIYHQGLSKTTSTVTFGEDLTMHTKATAVTLVTSQGVPLPGQRVDLLRANASNTGTRTTTDTSGIAALELLPDSQVKLKIYHDGGSYVTETITAGEQATVQTGASSLTLTSSSGTALAGKRVDLLHANGSNTGVRANTNASGIASFEVLPGYEHMFKIYHNGGSYTSSPVVFDADVVIQTEASTLTFSLLNAPAVGARVDLLRSNGSNTGIRSTTDDNGIASFEILPGSVHQFKAYAGGIAFTSALVTGGEDAVLCPDCSSPRLVDNTEVMASPAAVASTVPEHFVLEQNYPNPFNPETVIQYALPEATHVRLELYDLAGRRLDTLVNGRQQMGQHAVPVNLSGMSTGFYVYRIVAGQYQQSRLMLLQK